MFRAAGGVRPLPVAFVFGSSMISSAEDMIAREPLCQSPVCLYNDFVGFMAWAHVASQLAGCLFPVDDNCLSHGDRIPRGPFNPEASCLNVGLPLLMGL